MLIQIETSNGDKIILGPDDEITDENKSPITTEEAVTILFSGASITYKTDYTFYGEQKYDFMEPPKITPEAYTTINAAHCVTITRIFVTKEEWAYVTGEISSHSE